MGGFWGDGAMQQVAQNEYFFDFFLLYNVEKAIDLLVAFFLRQVDASALKCFGFSQMKIR